MFGIVWILIGLVIISTFTATITTVLTASSLSNEAKLYGTKVGALQNSEEFRLGVKRNADVKGNLISFFLSLLVVSAVCPYIFASNFLPQTLTRLNLKLRPDLLYIFNC